MLPLGMQTRSRASQPCVPKQSLGTRHAALCVKNLVAKASGTRRPSPVASSRLRYGADTSSLGWFLSADLRFQDMPQALLDFLVGLVHFLVREGAVLGLIGEGIG